MYYISSDDLKLVFELLFTSQEMGTLSKDLVLSELLLKDRTFIIL